MTTGSQNLVGRDELSGRRSTSRLTDIGLIVLHGRDTADGWQIQFADAADDTLRPKLVVISDLSAVVPAGVAGDYNNNGVVDAADYVVWRNAGASDTLHQRSDARYSRRHRLRHLEGEFW